MTSSAEVEELYKGQEVSVYEKTHPFLDCIPVEEIIKDRKYLTRLLKELVTNA